MANVWPNWQGTQGQPDPYVGIIPAASGAWGRMRARMAAGMGGDHGNGSGMGAGGGGGGRAGSQPPANAGFLQGGMGGGGYSGSFGVTPRGRYVPAGWQGYFPNAQYPSNGQGVNAADMTIDLNQYANGGWARMSDAEKQKLWNQYGGFLDQQKQAALQNSNWNGGNTALPDMMQQGGLPFLMQWLQGNPTFGTWGGSY